MEHSLYYYYGLAILDALDNETRRARARHGTDGQRVILRRWAYRCMDSQESTCDLFMLRFKGLIDGYFGQGEADKAWDTVSALVGALKGAEGFVSGFEDDGMQEGVTDMLAAIRAAIARAKGIV